MERYVTATEANQHFSELLRVVGEGDTVTITSRGKPVADMIPSRKRRRGEDIQGLIDDLKKRPIRFSGPWKRADLYE